MKLLHIRLGAATVLAAAFLVPSAAAAASTNGPSAMPRWSPVASAGAASFRHIDAVSADVAWLGSDDGTVLRTTDAGRSWRDVSPPGAAGLHFRDIEARDAAHAVAMTAGPASDSRVYVTRDGGRTWQLTFTASNPATFFDGMAFYDAQRGLIVGDPTDGRFEIFRTSDGGSTWSKVAADMPAAMTDEYGFADGGTTIVTSGEGAWFGSGGSVSRVFHSADGGRTWDVAPTPIRHGGAEGTAGIYGLSFRTPQQGLALGGDFLDPDATTGVAALSTHGGPWLEPATPPTGQRWAAAWLPQSPGEAVTVGINGSDVSFDAGRHWTRFDTNSFNAVECASDGACWAAGGDGQVAVLRQAGAPYLVASGLDGALGSTVGPDGALYLPEGATGTIQRLDVRSGERRTWATGLPHRVLPIGGAMDVAFLDGVAYALVTLVSPDVGGTAADGIYRLDGAGRTTLLADIGRWSLAHPPTTSFFIPTGVQFAMQPYRDGFLVTDGHHNRILRVSLSGMISEVLTRSDVVPTGLDRHGSTLYYTEAGPVPHLAQNGRVLTFDPATHTARQIASGARLAVDVEVGPSGTIYALSQGVFTPGHPEGSPANPDTGSVLRVNDDGTMTPVAVGLDRPTSMEIIGTTAYVVTLADQVWAVAL